MNFNLLSFVCYIAFQINYVTTKVLKSPPAVTSATYYKSMLCFFLHSSKFNSKLISPLHCVTYVQKFDEMNSTIGKGIFYYKADQKCAFAAVLTECHRLSSGRKCQDLQPYTTTNPLLTFKVLYICFLLIFSFYMERAWEQGNVSAVCLFYISSIVYGLR